MNNIKDLIGKTCYRVVNRGGEEILFHVGIGESYKLYHGQDCCEDVSIESIVGDLSDLEGVPILDAEEVVYDNVHPDGKPTEDSPYGESFTWTFYKLRTQKGYVDIRFYGSSNGYYSESVDFAPCEKFWVNDEQYSTVEDAEEAFMKDCADRHGV